MGETRDDFSKETTRTLGERVGLLCSNAACRVLTKAAHSDDERSLSVGVACHISAAARGGPRYDETQTSEERGAISNGLWLCAKCATLIDKDPARYPVQLLRQWKTQAEREATERIGKQQLSIAQGVVSLIPGVGTGISAAISAGLAVLEGGGPLEVAIRTAYGAIPIPPGIRQITDTVVDTVLKIAFHHESLTDVVVNVARDQIPDGLPRHVFDTLINIVVHHQPVARVAGGLLDHFVKQYAPAGVGLDLPRALAGAASHLPNVFAALPPGLTHIPPLPHLPALPPHAPQAPHAAHVAPPFAHVASPRMVQPLHAAHA